MIMISVVMPAAAGPPSAGLFTSPPTDLGNIAGIIPLGNLNPGGGHVLPVDHMYIVYPNPFNGGADAYPVYAMADGKVVLVSRTFRDDIPDLDYGIYIQHSSTVTSQYDHLYGLSDAIRNHLESIPGAWIEVFAGFEIMFLGQLGAPEPLPVLAGEQVGVTKSYSFSWDIGVVDRKVHNWFAGHGPRRYPDFLDYAKLLGLELKQNPITGHPTINAACFLEYLIPGLHDVWFAQLLSTPKGCGRPGWDAPNRLRGSWFNVAVDEADEPPLFALEEAAISIIPDNLRPLTHVQIGVGSGDTLSALDPDDLYPQLDNPLYVAIDPVPGSKINPDPANVSPQTGLICYDLEYQGGGHYNTLLVKMTKPREILLKYDPTDYPAPNCAAAIAAEPSTWTARYVR